MIGLGLIGGSMARAVRARTNCKVFGYDANVSVIEKAVSEGVLCGDLADCFDAVDMLIVALYPTDVVDIILDVSKKLKKGCIVIDCTGVKKAVCEPLSAKLSDMGIRFIGGHPMAGREVAGYDNSLDDLFDGASMILCTDDNTDKDALSEACDFFPRLGFSQVKITTAREHDAVIAYTSQLAHIVSSSYIKSPTLDMRYGFSAGSFKDLTRVAKLNEEMWADLFLENVDAITYETQEIIGHLNEYLDALKNKDRNRLVVLLRNGRIRKEKDEAQERSSGKD